MQCVLLDIEPIGVRLDNLARSFFRRNCDPADCLNYLLPNERSSEVVYRLRQANLITNFNIIYCFKFSLLAAIYNKLIFLFFIFINPTVSHSLHISTKMPIYLRLYSGTGFFCRPNGNYKPT
jgi:hypothetical protein